MATATSSEAIDKIQAESIQAESEEDTNVATSQLSFSIVEQEEMKKGGSINPLIEPQYSLLHVKAVLTEQKENLSEQDVEEALHALLERVVSTAKRENTRIDGVTAFLYASEDHIAGDSNPIGHIEWWPKEHSFAPDNATNIENKETYVVEGKSSLCPNRQNRDSLDCQMTSGVEFSMNS